MSHFTKVATKINHLPSFLRALDRLNLRYAVGSAEMPATVRGYLHQEITAEVAVDFGKYDLGLVRGQDGNYEVAADWWGIESTTGRTEREVMDEIARAYSIERVSLACREAGWEFEQPPEVNAETGEVEMVACRWS